MKVIDANAREEILKHARKVFAEVGYKEATIRQICKSAKANVCLISYYFGGKEGLYKTVFEKIAEERMAIAQKNLGSQMEIATKEEFRIRLKMALEEIFSVQVSKSDELIIIQREMMDGMPRVGDKVQIFIGNVRKFFVDFVSYGIQKGFLKKHLDPHLTAMSALNMILGFSVQLYFSKTSNHGDFFFPGYNSKQVPEEIAKNFISIFLDGVINNESAK